MDEAPPPPSVSPLQIKGYRFYLFYMLGFLNKILLANKDSSTKKVENQRISNTSILYMEFRVVNLFEVTHLKK